MWLDEHETMPDHMVDMLSYSMKLDKIQKATEEKRQKEQRENMAKFNDFVALWLAVLNDECGILNIKRGMEFTYLRSIHYTGDNFNIYFMADLSIDIRVHNDDERLKIYNKTIEKDQNKAIEMIKSFVELCKG